MPAIRDAMLRAGVGQSAAPDTVTVYVPEGEGAFTEEERSRRPDRVQRAARDHRRVRLPGPAPGTVRRVRVRPGVPVRAGPPGDRQRPTTSATWCCTCRTRSGSSTCAARRRSGTPTSSGSAGQSTVGPAAGDTEPTPSARPRRGTLPPQPAPGRYAAVVEQAKERFKCGDLFEVVPGHVFHERCASPSRFYERLRERNPAPFEFLFNLGDGEYLVGASPEMYVRVNGDRVETCPISGTIARGARPAGGRGQHRQAARLGEGGVRADHVHRRGPQRQVPGLRPRQRAGDRPAADRDVQPPHPHGRPHRGPAAPGVRRARRVPHPHVGGDGDRRAEDLGHAVHRGPRGRQAALVRRARSARSASTAR